MAKARQRGFTLLEAMLGLVVLGLVLALTFAANRAMRDALQARFARLDALENAEDVLQGLARDLACALAPHGERGPVFAVEADGEGGLRSLALWTVEVSAPDVALSEAVLVRAEYRIESRGGGGGDVLVRRVRRAISGGVDEGAREADLLAGVRSLAVRWHDGRQWVAAWPNAARLPAGFRLRLAVEVGGMPVVLEHAGVLAAAERAGGGAAAALTGGR